MTQENEIMEMLQSIQNQNAFLQLEMGNLEQHNIELQNQLTTIKKGEEVLYKEIKQAKKQIAQLQTFVSTNLTEEKLFDIGCRAIVETTVTIEDMNGLAKELVANFNGIGAYFEKIITLIEKTADKIIEDTAKETSSRIYIPRSSTFG